MSYPQRVIVGAQKGTELDWRDYKRVSSLLYWFCEKEPPPNLESGTVISYLDGRSYWVRRLRKSGTVKIERLAPHLIDETEQGETN